jgi:phosphocarrier protein HPr
VVKLCKDKIRRGCIGVWASATGCPDREITRREKREKRILKGAVVMGEKIPVQLKDVRDVSEFVNILSEFDGDFDLYCGRYCVDAKSILGIMTMDLRNQLFLTGNCEPSDRRNLVRALRARAFA